jgi:hypothetical protein
LLGALLSAVLAVLPAPDGGAGSETADPAAVISAAAEEGPSFTAPDIRIRGNVVMPDEVYLAAIDLPPDTVADLETANLVREQILSFLLRSGYELAQVHVTLSGSTLDVDIEEGQVEKVVFRGKLTFQTIRFKLGLVLPYDVFNRPELDREIRQLSADIKMQRVWYELVPTQEIVHPRRKYELHVFFEEHDWDTGAWMDVRSGYPDGVELIGVYQGANFLLAGDRWRVSASGGGNLRQAIVDDHFYVAPSRAYAEAQWFTPEIGHGFGRPFVWLEGEGIERQRPDLCIENYYHVLTDGSLNLQYQFAPRMTLSWGFGTQYRKLFLSDIQYADPSTVGCGQPPAPPVPLGAIPAFRFRSFGLVRTDLIFDDGQVRYDRRHALTAQAKYFFGLTEPPYGEIRAQYQRVWSLGYDDFWLKAKGAWLWGEVLFHDEEPIGRHLRGVFGSDYVRHVASVSTEFRFSVTRDIFKISVFHDAAVFGHLTNRACLTLQFFGCTEGAETIEVADSFGAGFHALVEGMLQVDAYLAFGFASRHPYAPGPPSKVDQPNGFDTGAAINIEKVF